MKLVSTFLVKHILGQGALMMQRQDGGLNV